MAMGSRREGKGCDCMAMQCSAKRDGEAAVFDPSCL